MRYRIKQLRDSDCGFICMKIVLANLRKNKGYLFLKDVENRQYSFYMLQKIAEKYSFDVDGYYVDDILSLRKRKHFIAQIIDGQRKHFVIIKTITRRLVFIYDPAIGDIIMKMSSFKKYFLDMFYL